MKFSMNKILKDLEEWNKVDPLEINKRVDSVDSDESWNQLVGKRSKGGQNNWLRYAAVISLLITSVFVIYLIAQKGLFSGNTDVYVTAENEVLKHVLPDSTVIWLKPGGSLSYESSYNTDHRNVTLKGIAFFEVSKNKTLPFVINSERSSIEVLGTSFLYDATQLNKVQVYTGVVKFSNKADQFKILKKGDAVVLSERGDFENQVFDLNGISWKTNRLVFENASIEEVIKTLSDHYKVSLTVDVSDSTKITASFDENTIEEVIEYIKIASDITLKLNEN